MSAGVEGPEKRKRRMREKKKKEIRTQSSSFPYITSLADRTFLKSRFIQLKNCAFYSLSCEPSPSERSAN